MRWPIPLTMVFCLLTGIAGATPAPSAPGAFGPLPGQSPGEQCRAAIAAAERGHGIPPQLLASIGRVESGRRDPVTGAWSPWPWTINAEGQGSWFETKAQAMSAVQALQASGVRSIDIGCMQVNLMHHPQAFPNLAMAFEPAINADYAARFLVELHGKTGDWAKATADYHSANPAEGEPYAAKVASVWPEEQRKAGSPPVQFAPGRMAPVRGGQFANGFARRQPPRMMPLTVETPGRLAMASATDGAPTSGGSLAPLGMRWAGEPHQAAAFGQAAMNPGRGLDFYRTVPIRQTLPLRLIAKLPNRPTR